MSKIKSLNSNNISNGNFPVEEKFKKKLNKRQRKIHKKQRQIRQKIKNKKKEFKLIKSATEEVKNSCDENHNTFKRIDKSQNSKPNNTDVLNSENYSSNWKQLQQVISNSKKDSFQNPKKRKKVEEELTKSTPIFNNGEVSKKNKKINIDKKSLVTKSLGDVDSPKLIEGPQDTEESQTKNLKSGKSFNGPTKVVAIDCEMVGGGLTGEDDILARVSIVNQFGNILLDKYVKPREKVIDYRTEFSGIRKEDVENAESFESVQKEVSKLLSGKIVVGHGMKNDFQCLYLSHPKHMTRDTSKYKPFRQIVKGKTPKLKKLSEKILGVQIQSGEHNSIQDAQAAMRLYCLHRKEWEKEVSIGRKTRKEGKAE